jgi:DNA-binding transcriptional LysR family regulator
MSSDFTIQQLRAFVAVAAELNFRRAAERMHTSQPPLSRQIKALEETLGVRLFDRQTRKVALTAAGQAFLPEAQRLLTNVEAARRAAVEAMTGESGTIGFGYIEPAAYDVLPRVLPRFRALFPKVDLELHEMLSSEAERALYNRTIEIALLRPPVELAGLELHVIYADRLVAALPEDHPLAGRTISLSALADESFVTYSSRRASGIQTATLQACAAGGFSPEIVSLASSTPMLLSLVAAGRGVGLIPHQYAMVPRLGVRFANLIDHTARSHVAIAWRAGDDRAAYHELHRIMKEIADQLT